MKNTWILVLVVAVVFLFAATQSVEKSVKLGHVNSQELLEKMPEVDSINKRLQKIAADNEKQLTTMAAEYETKVKELQNIDPNTPESIQNLKYQETMDLQNRIRRFQTQAQQDIEKKRVELVQPILDRLEKAIDQVATENNYDYIFDTSFGTVLHSPESDNVMTLVSKKLNIK